MKIRTVVPKRYIDVLQRGEDVDINMYDEGDLIEGYKFDGDYFRERIANLLVVSRTEDFAVILHPLTGEYELHHVTEKRQVLWDDIDESCAGMAQRIWDLYNNRTPGENILETIIAETATTWLEVSEVLYGNR